MMQSFLMMIIAPLLISHPRFARWARFLNPFLLPLTPEELAEETDHIRAIEGCVEERCVRERMRTVRSKWKPEWQAAADRARAKDVDVASATAV